MSDDILTANIWAVLTKAIRETRHPVLAAVAYFGRGGARMLPLPAKSRLAVDASEVAVKSGQTCPEELKKLVQRGVLVFSVPHLHAKAFLVGSKLFVGSTNVSRHSAELLVEAVVVTSERHTLRRAREFLLGLCRHELGPEALDRLQGMYRAPRLPPGMKRRKTASRKAQVPLPRLRIAQLDPEDPPPESRGAQKAGLSAAKELRSSGRGYVLEDFWWRGDCSLRTGDTVIQILHESPQRRMVSPPGNVIHMQKWRRGRTRRTFIYLEVPKRRRIEIRLLARRLGRGALRRLQRDGLVRDQEFSGRLLGVW